MRYVPQNYESHMAFYDKIRGLTGIVKAVTQSGYAVTCKFPTKKPLWTLKKWRFKLVDDKSENRG